MPLLLPNLDDRRWADLVDEGRALIPVYGPEWTDHNAHDPGITIMELLAWVAEMDIFTLNRVSDDDRRKFLRLVGVSPHAPLPARAVLSILLDGTTSLALPAGAQFSQTVSGQDSVLFRSARDITLVPGSLDVLQFRDARGYVDLTPDWHRRRVFYPLGTSPQPEMEFYLGFSQPLPVGVAANLYFSFSSGHSNWKERARILDEAALRQKFCRPPHNPCAKPAASPATVPSTAPLVHHGVRIVWEYRALSGGQLAWRALNPLAGEVLDFTRALSLNGSVQFRLPSAMQPDKFGASSAKPYYLRCRISAGAFDAAPLLEDVVFNAVQVLQSVPASMSFPILANTQVNTLPTGDPKPNELISFRLELDGRRRISSLTFLAPSPDAPAFRLEQYTPPTVRTDGLLALEAVFLGFGNGLPSQTASFSTLPVEPETVRLYSLENDAWKQWQLRPDFDSSTRKDLHAVLDAGSGSITFGDGEHGRVPPEFHSLAATPVEKCLLFAAGENTLGPDPGLAAGTVSQLALSAHNQALFFDASANPDGLTVYRAKLASISNPGPVRNGAAEETISLAAARADRLVGSSPRAVTLADYERLALSTPGTRVARARALPDLYPAFACFSAPGMITVVILPYLPQGKPCPSPGLLSAVTAYLNRRRIIGTRVQVIGPQYVDVAVRAEVQSIAGTDRSRLQQAIVAALNNYFDPLLGGPEGKGWPFGRDVYRAEVLRVIDQVSGVDHVNSMALIEHGCEAVCGNVCLGPIALVAAGAHEITVL
jgi:Baseplate J-like protein